MAVSFAVVAESFEYGALDLGCRHSGQFTGVNASSLLQRVGHIVPISCPALVGMRRRHAVSPIVENAPGQNCGRALRTNLPCSRAMSQLCLHSFEQRPIHNRFVFTLMNSSPIEDLSDI